MQKGMFAALVVVWMVVGCGFADKPERPSREENLLGWPTNALQRIDYGILLEIEGFGSRIGGMNESDVVVATAAFDLEVEASDWMFGHLGLIWEQDSREEDNVDEAYIALGSTENSPFHVVAGRFYQPVGNVESAFISDPLTLELMEMNQTAGMVGYENDWLDVSAGAFKGDVKAGYTVDGGTTNAVSDSTISDFFASAALVPAKHLKFGAYWLSDLMETYNYGGIGGLVSDQPGYEKVGAAGLFVNAYLGPATLGMEFASALDDYRLAGGKYRPNALNIEGSVLLRDKVTVGVKYESSSDLYAGYDRVVLEFGDKLPGEAYGVVVAYAFHENATVRTEYLHVEELDDDARGNLLSLQLALQI